MHFIIRQKKKPSRQDTFLQREESDLSKLSLYINGGGQSSRVQNTTNNWSETVQAFIIKKYIYSRTSNYYYFRKPNEFQLEVLGMLITRTLIHLVCFKISYLIPAQQPTKGQGLLNGCYRMFIRLETEVIDHPASVGVTCGQQVESLSRCWLSSPELHLHISSYQLSHNSGFLPMPYTSRKPSHLELNQVCIPQYELKALRLKMRDHGAEIPLILVLVNRFLYTSI